jgi:uncharacterized membrane protein
LHNPSIGQKAILVASTIGFIDSVYLAVLKLTENKAMCIQGSGGCWTVNTSEYSSVFGIPISVLGAAAYIVLIILTLSDNKLSFLHGLAPQLSFGIATTGFLYSIYLTYLEIAVIKAVCPFCIVSAICMLVIFASTLLHLIKSQSDYKLFLEDKNG